MHHSELQFIPFRSRQDRSWSEAWALYEASFPACERWDASSYDRAFADPAFEADAILLDGAFVGLLFHWTSDGFHYVEHLAVSPHLRGQHLGSRALEAFCRDRRVILEIDPPVDDISRRRKGFYERNGFIANDYDYTHLPYHRGCKGHRLVIMSSPHRIDEAEYRNFLDYMRRRVMVF